MNLKGNAVFWGKPEDAVANNLMKNNVHSKDPLPRMLAGVQYNPDVKLKKPNSLLEGAKNLAVQGAKAAGTSVITSIADTLLPMLLAGESPEEDNVTQWIIKKDYLDSLEKVLRACQKLE